MQERGLNRRTLAEKSGVPYTTIVHFYTNGYENTKLSTLQRLCDYFGVPLDYLVRDDLPSFKAITESLHQPGPASTANTLTPDEHSLLSAYRSLNEDGRTFIRAAVTSASSNPAYQKDTPNTAT